MLKSDKVPAHCISLTTPFREGVFVRCGKTWLGWLLSWRHTISIANNDGLLQCPNRYSMENTKASGWRDTECLFRYLARVGLVIWPHPTRASSTQRDLCGARAAEHLQSSCGNAGRTKDIDAVLRRKSTQSLYVRRLARRRRHRKSPSRLSTGAHETLEASRFCDQQEAGPLG